MNRFVLKDAYASNVEDEFEPFEHTDVLAICEMCARHGYAISEITAYNAWLMHSSNYEASWLYGCEKNDALEIILKYCNIV